VERTSALITVLNGCKVKLDNEMVKINEYVGKMDNNNSNSSSSNNDQMFATEKEMINKEIVNTQKLIHRVREFKGHLEIVVFGTMCFDVVGATSKIDTVAERSKFAKLTRDAMELACSESGVDADLVLMEIVKQRFILSSTGTTSPTKSPSAGPTTTSPSTNNSPTHQPSSRRSVRRHLKEAQEMEEQHQHQQQQQQQQHYDRLLMIAERKFTLRVGVLIGFLCNCVDEEPISDVWNLPNGPGGIIGGGRRRRLGHRNQHLQQDTTTTTTTRSTQAAAPTTRRQLQLHEDAFFPQENSSTTSRGLMVAGTSLQIKYLKALHDAFQRGPLAGVVEVHQIQCAGFLSHTEALDYLNDFREN